MSQRTYAIYRLRTAYGSLPAGMEVGVLPSLCVHAQYTLIFTDGSRALCHIPDFDSRFELVCLPAGRP